MIAAGTGILPFIDLLDFLLKKVMYHSLNAKGKDTSLIKPEQNYDQFFSGAKFRLFCAFKTLEDFIGYEWIGKIAQVSKEYNLGLFESIVRIEPSKDIPGFQKEKSYFDKKFYKEKVGTKFDKLWVCGPPKMHTQIYDDFTELGVEPDRIFYV